MILRTDEFENPKCRSGIYYMMTIACLRKKNWVKKSKTQNSLGVLRNIENFNHNSAENDNFDEGQIWKSKMPVWNLLDDDNSLPQ